MNKSTLNKVGIALSLCLLSYTSYSSELNQENNSNQFIQAQRNFILGCSLYVVGTYHPVQSNKEIVLEYLNYLHVLQPDLGLIIKDVIDNNSGEKYIDVQRYIDNNNLNREQGITYCAINSIKVIDNIKNTIK